MVRHLILPYLLSLNMKIHRRSYQVSDFAWRRCPFQSLQSVTTKGVTSHVFHDYDVETLVEASGESKYKDNIKPKKEVNGRSTGPNGKEKKNSENFNIKSNIYSNEPTNNSNAIFWCAG
ncbi:hypothetical protein DPV78_003839 [Talaromyces pinophilus]|nr:hypothetical protein DPV78_003839 [Talaromyces pinophilus]